MTVTLAGTVLVGRDALLQEAVTALSGTTAFGAVVVGEHGIGKTAFGAAVLAQVGWPGRVLKVTGGPSLRKIPYGALAPYLSDLTAADAQSPVAILRAVLGHLNADQNGRTPQPPLVVIDDAHELDDSSGALLSQLVSARRAKLLVLTRDIRTGPAELLDLSGEGLLTRLDLPPLDRESVAELCGQVLGGPVLTGTSSTLARATGGNPLFLHILLDQGVTEGYLVERNGVWRLINESPLVNVRLSDLIRSQLRQRSPEEIEVLEVIALAQPIGLAPLIDNMDLRTLERLRADGLVLMGPGPDKPVTLQNPLHAEVLRAQVPAARSMEVRRRVLAVLASEEQTPEGFLRRVSWGMDCGIPPEDPALLRAATVANALRHHEFAMRAARAVSSPELRSRALLEIARVQLGLLNAGYAQELLDEVLRRCTDLRTLSDAIQLSFELKLKSGAPFEALRADVERWRSLIADRVARAGSADPADPVALAVPADEVAQSYLGTRVLECYALIVVGHFAGVEEELKSVLEDPEGNAETRVGALVLLTELLGLVGRPVEGARCSGEALALIDAGGPVLLRYREQAVARHVMVLVSSGQESTARDLLQEYSDAHPNSAVYFAGWADLVDGVSALRGARNREARDRLILASEALSASDTTQATSFLTGITAYASALAGDTVRATSLMKEFGTAPHRGPYGMRQGGLVFVAAANAVLGISAEAAPGLLDLAAAAEKDQLQEIAAVALRLALMLGDSGALVPLLRVLRHYEGPDAEDIRAFAVAARARDTTAMIAAATAAGEHGSKAFEFAGLSLALTYLGEQGSSREARTLQRRLIGLGEQREGPVPSSLSASSPSTETPRLTPTERGIVALVKEGRSNREIADSKSVSIRTVEGHLYRIFAKLGINRREELREP